jgi:hypothetical protein
MKMKMRLIVSAMWVACMAPVTAIAEDTQVDPEIATIEKRQKLAEAQKAEYDAKAAKAQVEQAAAQARFAFLPKPDADGKVTLGQGAGTIETNLLLARAVQAVAHEIVNDPAIGSGTIILAGDEELNFDQLTTFRVQTSGIAQALQQALGAMPNVTSCNPPLGGLPAPGAAPLAIGIASLVSTAAGALKSDTELQGVSADTPNALLVRAVAAEKPNTFILPSLLTRIDINSRDATIVKLCQLQVAANQARTAIPTKPTTAADKKKASDLTAAVKLYDDYVAGLIKPDDKGNVPLVQIYRQSKLEPALSKNVLRVFVDKAGGSLLTRRNLWTSLGARAIGVSGGLLASYTIFAPDTGMVVSAATYRCTTKLAGLRQIQGETAIASKCSKN